MRKWTLGAAIAASMLLIPGTASAGSRFFEGAPNANGTTPSTFTTIQFWVKRKKVKGKIRPTRVFDVQVYNEENYCYGKLAVVGPYRWRYGFGQVPSARVGKSGKFTTYDDTVIEGHTIELWKFKGKITAHHASGTYQAKQSEAGIEFGYCGDNHPRKWSAKGFALGALPPEGY